MPVTELQENSPLPANPYHLGQPYDAYEHVLAAEKQAIAAQDVEQIRNVRIVGFTLLNAPNTQQVALEALESPSPEGLCALGRKYLVFFILPFRNERSLGRPEHVEIGTPLYAQTEVEVQAVEFPDCKSARRHALIRDGLKCMVTRKYDVHEVMKSPALSAKIIQERTRAVSTGCAHILPVSLNPSEQASPLAEIYSADVWQVLKMVGGFSTELVASLQGAGINQLGNIMTMSLTLRIWFESLWLWFERVEGRENEYKICYIPLIEVPPLPDTIAFSTRSQKLPLPRADFLAVHAAACRVARLSGVARYLEMLESDLEEEEGSGGVSLLQADFASKLHNRLQLVPPGT
ncbi:hypothetical protein C8R46DRAFT_118391 [Mycena filopes]|nr:hypothetical protein C8R46DRAFT_118391 [Mycena filopes]